MDKSLSTLPAVHILFYFILFCFAFVYVSHCVHEHFNQVLAGPKQKQFSFLIHWILLSKYTEAHLQPVPVDQMCLIAWRPGEDDSCVESKITMLPSSATQWLCGV